MNINEIVQFALDDWRYHNNRRTSWASFRCDPSRISVTVGVILSGNFKESPTVTYVYDYFAGKVRRYALAHN